MASYRCSSEFGPERHGLSKRSHVVKQDVCSPGGGERIVVLLYRCYIVHESVVFELRVVLQYRSVRDARA